VFADDSAQWLAAAAWARDQLRADPQASIAIVAPNIGAPGIESALRQILCPQHQLDPAAATPPPYHISLGAPLELHPVARDALNALAAFGGRPLPMEAVSRLLLSPFIKGAADEFDARCRLEAAARARLAHQIRFARLLAQLADERGLDAGAECPRLLHALRAAQAVLEAPAEDGRRAQPPGHWAQRFDQFLSALGWPGAHLASDEFQAANALRRELHNLATLELASAAMRASEALAWLRRRGAEQAFQPEAHAAPVQALGVHEAAGQRFDALWFGNLTEAEWPPPARPNPFIELTLQRAAGVPVASTEDNRAHAEAVHRRLLASADAVVLSRPAFVDEVAAEASVFFAGAGAGAGDATVETAEAAAADTPARIIYAARPQMESLADATAPALAVDSAGGDATVAGGVAVVENQAKCPFRAFALHRLRAREVEANAQGLGAPERGEMVHRALQLVWQVVESAAKLRALTDDGLRQIIAAAVAQAAQRYTVSSGCGDRFGQVQARWLAALLDEWLGIERARGEFTVAKLEAETEVALGGLKLACKIDRVDRLADGSAALIDYKTGAPGSLNNWAGSRPQSPQLPLYAIAGDAPGAVAFAQVKRGRCGFSGAADGDNFGPGVPAVAANKSLKAFADWDELVAHWRRALPALAAEFRAGDARVAPYQPAVCERCNLHTLCRVGGASA